MCGRTRLGWITCLGFCFLSFLPMPAAAETVFRKGTIFVSPNIVTKQDPTSFQTIRYTGQGMRQVYDRRVNNWVQINAFLFQVTFNDGLKTEAQVNPEFGSARAARRVARFYARAVGQLPTALRKDVHALWIHKGVADWGGGNNSILIHTGRGEEYIRDGIMEETLVHEATHTSIDSYHANSPAWKAAQNADGRFISPYAQQNPEREDMAESLLMFLMARHFPNRVPAELVSKVRRGIPNRIKFFERLNLRLHPYPGSRSSRGGRGSKSTDRMPKDITGTYKASGNGGTLRVSVWGNGYFYVDWGGRRYVAYLHQQRKQLWLYQGDPATSRPGWIYEWKPDGSFHFKGEPGQSQVLTRIRR